MQGITPVLAHPERIEAFQKDPELLQKFVEQGMLSQVTGGSFLGYFGDHVQKFTRYMMRRGLVHIIASDTHFADGRRSPKLPPGVEAAAKILGEEQVKRMVVDTPKAILDNQPVEVDPPRGSTDSKKWWKFWKSDY